MCVCALVCVCVCVCVCSLLPEVLKHLRYCSGVEYGRVLYRGCGKLRLGTRRAAEEAKMSMGRERL